MIYFTINCSTSNISHLFFSASPHLLSICLFFLHWLPLQCGVHLDQPSGGGGGAGGIRAGGPGPGGSCHQCCPGRALPHCRCGGGGRPRRHSHQLPRGEAAHAPERRLLSRPTGPHIRGLQYVRTQLQEVHPSMWLITQQDSRYSARSQRQESELPAQWDVKTAKLLSKTEIRLTQTSCLFLPVISCLNK